MKKWTYCNDYIKRWFILLLGLTIMAFGIALSIQADVGNTPVSGLSYVISLFSKGTVGEWTIITHCIFILIQILLLHSSFKLYKILQLVASCFLGYMIDFALWCIQEIVYRNYLQQLIFCSSGIFLMAVGISLEVVAGVITLAGEGVVLALSNAFQLKFSSAKILFDMGLVGSTCLLSLVFLHRIEGVREGTILAAILVGIISRPMIRFETKMFT